MISNGNKILPGIFICFLFILALSGITFAQQAIDDSVRIKLRISTCPMAFRIDSLFPHPDSIGEVRQDTFFLAHIYRAYEVFAYRDSLDWNKIYLVATMRGTYEFPEFQAIRIFNDGCILLDFELCTYAYELPGSSTTWWQPSDTNYNERNVYLLQAIATGIGTPWLDWVDTLNFQFPPNQAYNFVVHGCDNPLMIKDSTVIDPFVKQFYSRDLFGWDPIPTIDSLGLNLKGCVVDSLSPERSFYLHLALTTPESNSWLDRITGLIVLQITAKPRH